MTDYGNLLAKISQNWRLASLPISRAGSVKILCCQYRLMDIANSVPLTFSKDQFFTLLNNAHIFAQPSDEARGYGKWGIAPAMENNFVIPLLLRSLCELQ